MRRRAAQLRAVVGSLVGIVALSSANAASAQQVQLQVHGGPHYQGQPIDVFVVAEGFEDDPTPEIEIPPFKGARLEFIGVSPNIQSSIRIVNGSITRSKTVRFTYRYRLVVQAPGRVRIGAFRVKQGAVERRTRAMELPVRAVGKNNRVRIKLDWPDTPVYPGQRVPVVVEWIFEAEMNEQMHGYRIEAPIFNRSDLFRYIDDHPEAGDSELRIMTSQGPIVLKATVRERTEKGRRFKAVTATRILVPLEPGEYEFPGATVVIDEVTRWRRDLFGQRTPVSVSKVPAIDEGRRLVVRDVPTLDRPESYAGAIGRGFSLEAQTDRSVLQVGDPIALTLILRGDGNLEGASLPDLSGEAGLSPELFRVPSGKLAGVIEEGVKTFRVPLRVLDPSVREVPPLSYSYFDIDSGEFVTVESRPIALSVRRVAFVTADDVVSAIDSPPESAASQEGFDRLSSEVSEAEAVALGDAHSVSGRLVLTGANLSIVRDPKELLAGPEGARGMQWIAALYVIPLGLVAASLWLRRRADRDPRLVERNRVFREKHSRIRETAGKPGRQAAREIVDALRVMLKVAPEARPDELDAFLSECDAVAYAPTGDREEALDEATYERALALARAIEEHAE